MPPRARRLSETDKAIWANYAARIAPLPGKQIDPPSMPPPTVATPAEPLPRPRFASAAIAGPRSATPPLSVGAQPGGIDTATWTRFRTGKLLAVRKLDLHGMTAQRAFHALTSFLRSAHADQVRCVEVITGRGSGESGGVIRRELPLWLNLPEIRPIILAAVHPHALNPGSVRLYLRRHR